MDASASLTGSERSKTPRKQTCRPCRQRKVRCDGHLPSCQNCERLGFSCAFSEQASKPQKLRGTKACVECRTQKTRCSGTTPQCTNCSRRGVKCVYPEGKRPLRHTSPAASHASTNEQSIDPMDEDTDQHDRASHPPPRSVPDFEQEPLSTPSQEGLSSASQPTAFPNQQTFDLVDAFFEKLYSLPSYSFLHPGLVKERLADATLDDCLLFALCSIASLHLYPAAGNNDPGPDWNEAAEHLIWQHLESPSIPRLQALLLCINYRMRTQAFQRAFMLAGLAARAATAMRLNHERTDLDFISSEIRRRIIWSLKLMESYFSIGLPEFELCPFETIYLELPCREEDFSGRVQSTMDGKVSHLQEPGEGKSFHFCVRLASIRRDVMKLTRSLALYDQPFLPLAKLIHSLGRELLHIRDQMAASDLSSSEIARLIQTPWLPRHIMMHLSWHQSWCDLYRLLLRQYPDAAPAIALEALDRSYIDNAEQICLKHATAIVQILSDLNQQCTITHRLEFDSAICGYHATRLLMFISRSGTSGDRPTAEFATSRAELCLAAIKRFYRPSALVSPIIEDMDRMIKTFSPNSPSNLPSPEFETDRRDPALRLSGPARARQGLEIHSLLRRSGFLDDSYDDSTSPGSTDSASAARRQMISQQISALSSRTLANGQSHAAGQQFQDTMNY